MKMTPEHWESVRSIVESTLEVDPKKRQNFLDQACADSSEVRREVVSLLRAHEGAGAFFNQPALVQALAAPDLVEF